MRRRGLALLAAAACTYVVAARAVAPGFYDGIAPPAPYRWVSPPPQFHATNQQPLAGRATFKVTGGTVEPGTSATQDRQALISFVGGAFVAPADGSLVVIQIEPQPAFPDPGQVHVATNVYCVTSSSPLAPGKDVLVTLQYSDQLPAPGDVYTYQPGGQWRKLGSTGNAPPYFISVNAAALGCFAGGYPANASQTAQGLRLSGGQALPIIAALAILIVVLAGIPLAVLRRRGEEENVEDEA